MRVADFNRALVGYLKDQGDLTWFQNLRDQVYNGHPPMSQPEVGGLLNLATGFLDPDESYLEVGTARGFSLLSAARGRRNTCAGIDNFSQYDQEGTAKEALLKNILRFGNGNVQFFHGDFRSADVSGHRVGVFYYDGNHSYKDTLEGLEWAIPHMAQTAMMMIDDYSLFDVDRAVLDFQAAHRSWRTLYAMKSTHMTSLFDEDRSLDWAKMLDQCPWWLGTCILYNR